MKPLSVIIPLAVQQAMLLSEGRSVSFLLGALSMVDWTHRWTVICSPWTGDYINAPADSFAVNSHGSLFLELGRV